MHSGRTMGWSGEIEAPAGEATRQPGVDLVPEPRRVRALTAPRETDRDHAQGLDKFDLGMVPASVTPPRSWRYAAWFAVASSAAALGGLLLATSALVSNTTNWSARNLPETPRGRDHPPLREYDRFFLGGDAERPQALHPGRQKPLMAAQQHGGAFGQEDARTRPAWADQQVGSIRPLPHDDHPDQRPSRPDHSEPAPSEPGPPSTHRPPLAPPANGLVELLSMPNPQRIEQVSGHYFDAVSAGDLRGAYELTTGGLRAEGFAAFADRYRDAKSIRVEHRYVAQHSTITTLRVVDPTGEEHVERHRLRFSGGAEPRIRADDELS